MYCIIDPFTNKVIEFSSFVNDEFYVAKSIVDSDGAFSIIEKKALCITISEYDSALMGKVYNTQTNLFE